MVSTRLCQHCHGQKRLWTEYVPGKWKWVTCPACKGTGRVAMLNI